MAALIVPHRPQRTLAREARVRGIGYLSGADVELRFRPAPPQTGIVFVRTDLAEPVPIPARIENVVPRARRTAIQRGRAAVEMIEHVMAALAGLKIDNCTVEIDAAETPGCDGSSRPFLEALERAGAAEQDAARPLLVIAGPLAVEQGGSRLEAHPAPTGGLSISYTLDYGTGNPIGRQSQTLSITPEVFHRELAPSRTFLLEAEARELTRQGIGRRTTARDLLIFGPSGPLDGNVLRFPDECVRHKILDVIGDLALLGMDVRGRLVAHKSGHQLNAALVRALLHAASSDRDWGRALAS